VKLLNQEQHIMFNPKMFNPKLFVKATFATVAVLSLGLASHAASAQPIFVTHGSHGAIAIVDGVSVGATALPTTPSQGSPNLVTRGPGGAAFVVNEATAVQSMAKAHPSPKLVTMGPHGAASVVE
jgi:hypothetical protein